MRLNFNILGYGPCRLVPYKNNNSSLSQRFVILGSHEKVLGITRLKFSGSNTEIFLQLFPEFEKKEFLIDIFNALTSLAFDNLNCENVIFLNPSNNNSYTEVLESNGYSSIVGNNFRTTREAYGLSSISKIILKEKYNLLSYDADLTLGLINRVAPLWYQHFSKGVNLSQGGVERSFITLDQLSQKPHLQTFNMYRSDIGAVNISEDLIKKFLVEEEMILSSTKINHLKVLSCLGAHEGIVRVARCIYNEEINNGIFFAHGSYGLLAAALYGMSPIGYDIHLVDTDRNKGEKYLLQNLKESFELYPKAKTIFLDLKTIAGAVYNETELREIISLCKQHGVFLLVDAAHVNLNFYKDAAFADVVHLCQLLNYEEYAVVYTGSKTYGLERGRVGFIVISEFSKKASSENILVDLYRNIGAGFDLPFEITRALINTPLEIRKRYLEDSRQHLRYCMNLMQAYVEGSSSPNIDSDISVSIQSAIDSEFKNGIKGIKLVYKPQAGIQMKIDMQGVSTLYFYNIQMFNSEIFSYTLNKVMGIVAFHSFCLLNNYHYEMRLSFSYKDDVHNGMKGISRFVQLLTTAPKMNRHMSDIPNVKQYLEDSLKDAKKKSVNRYYSNDSLAHKKMTYFKLHSNSLDTSGCYSEVDYLPKAKL